MPCHSVFSTRRLGPLPVLLLLPALVHTFLSASASDTPPPAYTPLVTPAPDQAALLASQGFRQETFYTCNTVAGSAHCGWHVPVVKADAGAPPRITGAVAAVACLAAVFALGMR